MEDSFLNLPHHERKTFNKHFLVGVFCEFFFDKKENIENIKKHEKYFQDVFKREGFAEYKPIVKQEIKFSKESKSSDSAKIEQKAETIGLEFIDKNSERLIKITANKLAISENNYDGFEHMKQRIKTYMDIIEEKLGTQEILRTGLRKIDAITIEPVESTKVLEIFNPSLFGVLRSGIASINDISVLEDKILIQKEKRACNLIQRFIKLEKPKAFQAELDFDIIYYHDKISFPEVLDRILPELNSLHFDLFMWAVTEEMLKSME